MNNLSQFPAIESSRIANLAMHLLATACVVQGIPSQSHGETKVLYPTALQPGDTIRFVAPAGPFEKRRVDLAERRLAEMGFVVQPPKNLDRSTGYLAGTDEQRAAELMAAFSDPEVDAVFPVRGGYGTMRILNRLDFDAIRQNPKVLIGFSDITALHLAIHQRTGLVTFHSPNPDGGLGVTEDLSPFSSKWFWRALLQRKYAKNGLQPTTPGYAIRLAGREQLDRQPFALVSGIARGRLVGGNLSVIHALMGTPYEIETANRILFLEDVGEAPYRVDRMLQTLKLAGKLDEVAGVVLGSFTRRLDENTADEAVSIDEVLRSYFAQANVPVLADFPVGHQPNNVTLPIGVLAELDTATGTLRLLENPVRIEGARANPKD